MLRVYIFVFAIFLGCYEARADLDDRFAPFYFDPNLPTYVVLNGEIDARTPLAFSRLIAALPSIDTLLLSSPGGDVYSAILMAREVDRLGLLTRIPKDTECFSACAFIYFAGHVRSAEGRLGVHQINSTDPDLVAAQLAVSDISETLVDFGVPNDLFLIMLRTPPGEMHILDQNDLVRFDLIGPRQNITQETARSSDLPQEVIPQPPVYSLSDGTYSNGGLTVVIDTNLVAITYTGDRCIGALDAELRETADRISFEGEGCSISVTKLGPFDFSMDQGPGCSAYHGAACGLSGYVRRSK